VAWYDSAWQHRAPIAVDLGVGVTPPVDVTIALPDDWDEFWDNVLASGNDVRVTDSDGDTLLTYDLDAFDAINRTGAVEVQAWTPAVSTAGVAVLWLYWGNPSAADARTAFAPSTPKTGYVETARPSWPTFLAAPEQPGAAKPRQVLQKGSGETVDTWWLLDPVLPRYCRPSRGWHRRGEPAHIGLVGYDAGQAATDIVDPVATRLVECRGRLWARARVKAGVNGSDYTVELAITGTDGQVRKPRMLLRVVDATD